MRWQHPTRGLLAPADFIGLAEETGDIAAIGCWVLEPRCARQPAGGTLITAATCGSPSTCPRSNSPTPQAWQPSKPILADPERRRPTTSSSKSPKPLWRRYRRRHQPSLEQLKHCGVRIAIDDFGTGFSSLSTLANLPVDILKIDRSFVSGPASPASKTMLEGILGLADKLGLTVIAEGIESTQQLDLLRVLGCTTGQGYLLGRPAPPADLRTMLTARGPLLARRPAFNTSPVE